MIDIDFKRLKSVCDAADEAIDEDEKHRDALNIGERLIAVRFFLKGAHWQKRQMMKGAAKGTVHHFNGDKTAAVHYIDPTGVPMCYFTSPEGLKAGDKVKVIIIKEDRV